MDKKLLFVVDDSETNLTKAREVLGDDYTVMTMIEGKRALKMLERIKPDLILLDIEMPEMDGFEVLQALKNDTANKDIPVVFLTSMKDTDVETKALEMGVVDFVTKPFSEPVLLNRIKHHIDISALVRERTEQLNRSKQDIVFVLADVVENRDSSTGNHLGRTSRLVRLLLEKMAKNDIYRDRIKDWDFSLMSESSLLHDVGKIKTPDAILKKPGKLTSEEFEIMKTHTSAGMKIIEKIIARSGENPFLKNALLFALYHHEKWDGTGYPLGIKGNAIPLQGRIMAVVDVFDALVSKRTYKGPYSDQEALSIIEAGKNNHFDPDIVDIFMAIENKH